MPRNTKGKLSVGAGVLCAFGVAARIVGTTLYQTGATAFKFAGKTAEVMMQDPTLAGAMIVPTIFVSGIAFGVGAIFGAINNIINESRNSTKTFNKYAQNFRKPIQTQQTTRNKTTKRTQEPPTIGQKRKREHIRDATPTSNKKVDQKRRKFSSQQTRGTSAVRSSRGEQGLSR